MVVNTRTSEIRSQLDLDALTNICLLANTPLYIYRNFRDDSGIARLAEYEITFLSQAYTELTEEGSQLGVAEHVLGYSILAAVSLKSYYEAKNFFDNHDASWLEGGETIKNFHLKSDIATNVIALLPEDNQMKPVYYPSDSSLSNIIKL